MLARTSYSKDFVAACRKRAQSQLKAFDGLVKTAGPKAEAAFAPDFFNTMVLALDHYFMHRQRSLEGKDGNPLNEVRMLAVSLLEHDGVMSKDNTIKYDPAKAVTGIAIGDRVEMSRDTFSALAEAFFAEIEKRFP